MCLRAPFLEAFFALKFEASGFLNKLENNLRKKDRKRSQATGKKRKKLGGTHGS